MSNEVSLESFISSCDDMLIAQEGFGEGFVKGIGKAFGFITGFIGVNVTILLVGATIVIASTKADKKRLVTANISRSRNVTFVETSYIENINQALQIYKKDIVPVKTLLQKMSSNPKSVSKSEFYKAYDKLNEDRDKFRKFISAEKATGKTGNDLEVAKKVITEIIDNVHEITKYTDKIFDFVASTKEDNVNDIPLYDIENFSEDACFYANVPLSGIKVKEEYSKKELRQQKKNNN